MHRRLRACLITAALLLAGCLPGATPAGQAPPAAGTEAAPALREPAPAGDASGGPAAAPEGQEARSGADRAAPAPEPEATRSDDPPRAELQLPALPLWGEPGLHLVAEERASVGPAYAYAPVEMLGATLHPVRLPQGTVYVRVEGDAVYLHGLDSVRGGFSALPEPVLLHRLPLRVGDSWTVQFPGPMGDRHTYRVEAIEPVDTPAGERPAARVAVASVYGGDRTEWWVPGYGLVSYADGHGSWRAERELRREPEIPTTIGRPAPDLQAILWDDGEAYWITTLEGGRELFRVSDDYWRSWYGWADAGEFDLLTHTTFPGSWGIFSFAAFRYDQEAEGFRQLDWVSVDRTARRVAGAGSWGPGGTFRLEDFLGYPTRIHLYRFDGEAMRSDPADMQVVRASSAEAFVQRLFVPPPLEDADIVAMFRDPAVGEEALKLLEEVRQQLGVGAIVEPAEGNPGAFIVSHYMDEAAPRLLVEVEQGEHDFVITRIELLTDGE